MELAFSALLIFALTLPGTLMRAAFRVGWRRWKIPVLSASFVEQIAQSLFLSALLHGFWCLVCYFPLRMLHQTIDLTSLTTMLIGDYGKDSERLPPVLQSMTAGTHPAEILGYLLSLNVFSYVLGTLAHEQVRNRGWDYSIDWLRFDNPWFYLFYPYPEGAVLQSSDGDLKEFNCTVISAIVNHNDADVIYRGLLRAYNFCADGTLHSVHLEGAERRVFAPTTAAEKDFHVISGHVLILCLSEIKTFNIQYRFQEVIEASVPATAAAPKA